MRQYLTNVLWCRVSLSAFELSLHFAVAVSSMNRLSKMLQHFRRVRVVKPFHTIIVDNCLIDAIQSARFITPKKSKELINKLSTFVAPCDVKVLKRQLYVEGRTKANNESIYLV